MISTQGKQSESNHRSGLIWSIIVAIFCRILLNTARRFIYPFAPVLSRGLGVSLTAVTSLIAINQGTALVGVFFGPLSDRIGYRFMMLCGLAMLCVGMLGAAFFPLYWVVLAALLLAGLGKCIFDPAIQAFVGERVPYHRRGAAVGFLETSWAGSTLVGIPLAAFLIHAMGWRAPFFALGILASAGLILLMFLLPKDRVADKRQNVRHDSLMQAWRPLLKNPIALGFMGFAFFFSAANDIFFVVYGAWLESSFAVSVVALGIGTGVIGVAELCGEGLTASIADRMGLRTAVVSGSGLTIIGYMLLPLYTSGLNMALGGIFVLFVFFEFAIVTCFALCTEVMPGARATMISAFLASGGLGRVLGALTGGPIWLAGGIAATGFVSAGVTLLALISLLIGWRLSRHSLTAERVEK